MMQLSVQQLWLRKEPKKFHFLLIHLNPNYNAEMRENHPIALTLPYKVLFLFCFFKYELINDYLDCFVVLPNSCYNVLIFVEKK